MGILCASGMVKVGQWERINRCPGEISDLTDPGMPEPDHVYCRKDMLDALQAGGRSLESWSLLASLHGTGLHNAIDAEGLAWPGMQVMD